MPSPLVHAAVGYAVTHTMRRNFVQDNSPNAAGKHATWITAIGFSLLPDIDALVGLLMGDLGRYHNNIMNSMAVGVVLASIFALAIGSLTGTRPLTWALIALASYAGHIFLDYLTVGRGVMALWPFTPRRFSSPVPLFYGFHWSDGLFNIKHLWTFLSESAFVMVLLVLLRRVAPGGSGGFPDRSRPDGSS